MKTSERTSTSQQFLITTRQLCAPSHLAEPGCAVREALEDGRIDPDRYASYGKMQREIEFVARKQNHKLRVEAKQKWKKQTKAWHKQLRSDPRIRKKRGL